MPWNRQNEWTAAQFGVNSALLSATTNSNWIDVRSAGQVTFEIDVVNATAGALPVVFGIQTRRNEEATTVARDLVITVPAAPAGGIVYDDAYTHRYRYTTPAAATTYRKTLPVPVNDQWIRLTGITAAGAGAGDLISIHVRVGY